MGPCEFYCNIPSGIAPCRPGGQIVTITTSSCSSYYFKHMLTLYWPEAQLQVPTSEITCRPLVEQRGTGTQRIQDGTSQTLQDMNLCADSEINLEVGWPPAQDQAVAGSRIAISNENHKEELLSALKTLLEDIGDGIKWRTP